MKQLLSAFGNRMHIINPYRYVSAYDPQWMTFDGSTGFYEDKSTQPVSNLVTAVFRFNRSSFTGGGVESVMRSLGATGYTRIGFILFASDHAATNRRSRIQAFSQNNTGTNICRLISSNTVADGADHTVFYAFDGDNGTGILYVDGVDDDDTGNPDRIAPTTGTLEGGIGSVLWGSSTTSPGGQFYGGKLSYAGNSNTYLTNPTDFYHPTNGLQELDESGWTEWGAQPLTWAADCKMDTNNSGDRGALTKYGTITGPA